MLNGLFHSTQEPAGRRTIFELSTNLHYGVGGWHEDFTTCTSYFDVAHGRYQVKSLYINFFLDFLFFISCSLFSPGLSPRVLYPLDVAGCVEIQKH